MRGTDESLTEASCEIERRMDNCLDSCLQGCLSPHALGQYSMFAKTRVRLWWSLPFLTYMETYKIIRALQWHWCPCCFFFLSAWCLLFPYWPVFYCYGPLDNHLSSMPPNSRASSESNEGFWTWLCEVWVLQVHPGVHIWGWKELPMCTKPSHRTWE